MQKHSRGSPFQCSRPANLQQLHFFTPSLLLPPFSKEKKNQTKTCPLKLFINLHTSPLHWFLLLMLCAVRPLLFAFSTLNYQPPINPHSTTINSAQTYCTYGPNYSRCFNILDYILSAMHFDPLFSAVFLDISVMHSKVYLASSACPLGVIQTYRWHAPYRFGVAVMFGTNSWCWFLLLSKIIFYASLEDVLQNIHSHCS